MTFTIDYLDYIFVIKGRSLLLQGKSTFHLETEEGAHRLLRSIRVLLTLLVLCLSLSRGSGRNRVGRGRYRGRLLSRSVNYIEVRHIVYERSLTQGRGLYSDFLLNIERKLRLPLG